MRGTEQIDSCKRIMRYIEQISLENTLLLKKSNIKI